MFTSKRLRLGVAALCAIAAWGVVMYRVRHARGVDLSKSERSVFAPAGEDGVLETILDVVPPDHRFLVDLGAGDGITGSSSRNLIVNHGWGGLLVEAKEPLAAKLAGAYAQGGRVKALQALIDPGDIELILERHGVPRDLDLLIIGLKGNDWYVWRAIDEFQPKVVQIQYNAAFLPPQTMVIEYHPLNYWDGSPYFGASIQSLHNLGKRKGYELLYANTKGTSLFFVRSTYFRRFGIGDNSPLRLYRPCPGLPTTTPGHIWDVAEGDGHPRPPYDADLVVKDVRIPRTYVLGEF
jgi:hypothetical protein